MARKIRIAGLCLVVLIIIAAFSAMSYTQSSTVGDVQKAEITKTADTAVALEWKKVSAADGYFVYVAQGDDDYQKAATVKDGKQNTCTVKKLEQACEYDFYVTAYKAHKKGTVESKQYEVLHTCTRPAAQKLSNIASTDAGKLSFEWVINPKAAGYQIQYVQGDGKEFGETAQTVNIKEKATSSHELSKLKAKQTYAVRMRTYIVYNKEKLYGPWSNVGTAKIQDKVAMPADIDVKKPMVALTFDDGPGYNKASDKIVSVLEKYNARATFFMLGQNAKDHPKNLKRKVKLGCELANHTYDHSHYGSKVTASDIKKCSEAIYQVTGQYPTAFRSPGGQTTDLIRKECKAENMPLYYWSLDTQDWKYRNADHVYNAIMKNVQDGDIILMHEIYDSTAEAVARVVPALIKEGYQLVTCEELIYAKTGKKPVPGEQYLNATVIKNKTS